KGRRDRLGRDDDLQRAMELQVVEELRKQNEELRNEVNCRKFHLGHGRSLSMGARRRNGRVGNVDNVNDMNVVVKYMSGPTGCWGQLAAYIVKSVGAGGTDREVLTAGFIPDGMNYVKVKDVMALALISSDGGGWTQSDAQQASQDYIPPPPAVRTEEKKPEGGKANFEWGANSPEVLVKEEMKDDLRAINVTLPKLPDESTPHAGGPLMWGLDHRD
ncbi:unnamed protein product, partial [Durusdinium trenchii]